MALDIFAQYATDESLENNGTWFDIGGGARILVARSGNRKYSRRLTKEVERNRKIIDLAGKGNDDADTVADKKSEEIMVDVMAETILLGWEGITFKGKPLKYSVENAKKVLALRDFRLMVGKHADDAEAFRIKQETEQGED